MDYLEGAVVEGGQTPVGEGGRCHFLGVEGMGSLQWIGGSDSICSAKPKEDLPD